MNNLNGLRTIPRNLDDCVFQSLGDIIASNMHQIVERFKRTEQLKQDITKASNYFQKLSAIKSYYQSVESELLDHYYKNPLQYYDSYPTDWSKIFTPIEEMAWNAIRSKGRVVLYPQYPALEYFLDFANPGLKIALELDGKNFHNKERDFIRDLDLKRDGWIIYRITGKEMYRDCKEWFDIEYLPEEDKIEEIDKWILNTGDGVIEAIRQVHFNESFFRTDEETDYVYTRFCENCLQTLELHKS
jgi:very-short-patch-repair endonuclease